VLQKDAERAFEQLDSGTLELWRSKQREHNAKRPAIKAALIDALQKNNSASYASLAAKIDYWCSAGTIRRWVTSRDGYRVLKEIKKLSTSILPVTFAITGVLEAATIS